MIQDRLDKIEERLKQSQAVKESDKVELLNLLKTLRTEITRSFQNSPRAGGKHSGICRTISPRSHTQRKESGALQFVAYRSDFIGSGLRNISSTVSGDY